MKISCYIAVWTLLVSSCAIEFQVASQRTAIEEQILGAYEEMDNELVLMSSVRAVDASGNESHKVQNDLEKRATEAKQNQQFNMDDLRELKKKEILGEKIDGSIDLLPAGKGKKPKDEEKLLAEVIRDEENRDRLIIWQRVIEKSPDLKDEDLKIVRKNYHQQMVEKLDAGMWYQDDKEEWVKKQK